ncbi:MAG: RHS repeat-associated core domain-containing protein [Phycisphaerales bacterium]|nr:RHS repeat-associated core domain-containing protein [Phycisphaerales bacterium]
MSGSYAARNAIRFSTKPFDPVTGLGYWGYRWYSAKLGRWVSRDPIEEEGGVNLYRYVSNGPPGAIDPRGEFFYVAICMAPWDLRTTWTAIGECSCSEYVLPPDLTCDPEQSLGGAAFATVTNSAGEMGFFKMLFCSQLCASETCKGVARGDVQRHLHHLYMAGCMEGCLAGLGAIEPHCRCW